MQPLHGARYARAGSQQLQEIIQRDLVTWDYYETIEFYRIFLAADPKPEDYALLACNDRYFLFTIMLGRRDGFHPWLFDRCREVELDPDGYLDLWARFHYKSSLITFAGAIQEIMRDPEIRIAIFSATKAVADGFLSQIKEEFEGNESLKLAFPDVLYWTPENEASRWSMKTGIVVKRKSNPKEATVSAHGLVKALPTGSHFPLIIFDDMITEDEVTNPEIIQKITTRWELADNLGTETGFRKWHIGTRYHLADTYGQIIEREAVKPRIYAATHNGKRDGKPVFLTQKRWEEVKVAQKSVLSAQMLQNPAADNEATFDLRNFRRYMLRPTYMNVYIMGDPSKGRNASSDRTAIAVVGIDVNENKYLLDGFRHRMNQEQSWENLHILYKKWADAPGVNYIKVGWEQYGLTRDTEYFTRQMKKKKYRYFDIVELNWVKEGNQSKKDRVERLQPDIDNFDFFFPPLVYNNNISPRCLWEPAEDGSQIICRALPDGKDVKQFTRARQLGEGYRVIEPIMRRDEEGNIYDLTMELWQELLFFPFAPKDDLCDAVSRLYDMEPRAATLHVQESYETRKAWDH
ncbi:MAG: hypothetical protein GY952_14115 [Rhodobacteraceae bacterium]|nr:hypothetical protein [Paracoccaceae bacterium]